MAKMRTPDLFPEFQSALDHWLAGAQKIVDDYWTKNNFTHAQSPILQARTGGRFVIVTRHDRSTEGVVSENGSAFAFIDVRGGLINGKDHKIGDVLKAASFKQPAKNARGNIFDPNNGLAGMTECGPAYMK